MGVRLLLVTTSETIDISPLAGNIELSSDIETLGQRLSFQIAHSDAKLFPKNPCNVGDMVILTGENGGEVYRGIIISEERDGRAPMQYTSFDLSFYLNQSTAVYQFNRTTASDARQAIIKVASDFGVPIGYVTPMSSSIKKIYMDETPAAIIQDIITMEEAEKGYKIRLEMRNGKLYVEKRTDLIAAGEFKIATNVGSINILDAISEPARVRSIEEMRNRIKVVYSGSGDSYTVAATESDTGLIDRYGLLQYIETIDKDDAAKARQIARNRLKELGRVFEDASLQLIGNFAVRAGRLMDLSESVTGLTGRWLIKSVTHQIDGAKHVMDVALGDENG